MALVVLLSRWLRSLIPVAWLSSWGERLVEVVLFGIGLWALRLALKENVHTHEHENDGESYVHFLLHHAPAEHQGGGHRHSHAAFGIGTLHCMGWRVVHVCWACCRHSHFPPTAKAVAYLVAFGLVTVAAMAVFTWGIAWLAARFAIRGVNVYRSLMGCSAVAAMATGGFWLATSFR